MLSSVLKSKKAVRCLTEKFMLDKLGSGMIYSAVGHEFNVNESSIQYLSPETHIKQGYILMN